MINKYIKKIICCTLFLLIILFALFYKCYNPESRIKKLNEYTNVDNKKAKGWIMVQGTNIDMPIMYYDDVNDITDPTDNIAWTFNNSKKQTNRILIYSHNMKNVSSHPLIANKNHARFEQLMSFIYKSFINKNKYIQYTVDGKDHLYKIYAVSLTRTEELDTNEGNMTEKFLGRYIKDRVKKSYFKMNTDVSNKDNLITLVTCTRFFGSTEDYSFVIDAREVRENERITNYKAEETDNYEKIIKVLEGDD